jgi:hypothetical protein
VVSIGSWTLEAFPSWVTLDAGGGTGNAILGVTVAVNGAEDARQGIITINGVEHELTQAGTADPHSYFTWVGQTGVAEAETGYWANPDGDLLPNIAEFLLLRDPATADLPNVKYELHEGTLSLTFERRKTATDAELEVWWTEDLETWERYTGELELLEDEGNRQLLRAGVSTGTARGAMQLRFRGAGAEE